MLDLSALHPGQLLHCGKAIWNGALQDIWSGDGHSEFCSPCLRRGSLISGARMFLVIEAHWRQACGAVRQRGQLHGRLQAAPIGLEKLCWMISCLFHFHCGCFIDLRRASRHVTCQCWTLPRIIIACARTVSLAVGRIVPACKPKP